MGLRDAWKAQEDRAKQLRKQSKLKREAKKAHQQRLIDDPAYAVKVMKAKLGIDFDDYTDEVLLEKNAGNIERLRRNTTMQVAMDLATNLAGASTKDLYSALRAITEQNFIMMRQNEQIVRELKRLNRTR